MGWDPGRLEADIQDIIEIVLRCCMRRFLTFVVLGPLMALLVLTAISVSRTNAPFSIELLTTSFLVIASLALS